MTNGMTKVQWGKLRKGDKVKTEAHRYNKDGTMYIELIHGSVIRMNSNGSQALVRWDKSGNEIWYGRLGIEMDE